jgi:S1-C subfamily serine protease
MTDRKDSRGRRAAAWALAGALPVALVALWPQSASGVDARVLAAEKRRVEAIEKVRPAVVAVITGGGSGVLIDADGYALTNFHVTSAARGPFMKCGLPDGNIYNAVLVGEDKVGDVALIRLLPNKDSTGKITSPPDGKFPFAVLGDSDKLRAGDWSLAMGNPFMLSTDFTPTVTFGLISGVHRYQYAAAGGLLEYTDCIQIDTSINPGNSGGPLFNMDGELVGINGRGSFEKRGRVNSGVGYAISINQIRNFLGQLRSGMDTDHASLGASMESETDEGALSRILVRSIIDSDARRRGLDVGDQLITFAGRPMTTVNQFKNVLGLFPREWRVPLSYRRENGPRKEVLVRLQGARRRELEGTGGPGPRPGPGPIIRPGIGGGPAAAFYKVKAGFSNYYFNEQAQKDLWKGYRGHGDFTAAKGDWSLTGKMERQGDGKAVEVPASFSVKEKGSADGKGLKVSADINELTSALEPLNPNEKAENFKLPTDSGGFLLALYQFRQLAVYGDKGFVGAFSHGGTEPVYPPPPSGPRRDFEKQRVMAEVFRTKHAGNSARWYFAVADDPGKRWLKGQLIAFEVSADRDADPCEVYVGNYREVRFGAGRKTLPHTFDIWYGDKRYGTLKVTNYDAR